MSDDLYAGLILPTRAKRSALGDSAAPEDVPQTLSDNAHDEKRQKKSSAAHPLDLPATVAKLKKYMVRQSLLAKL